MTCAYATSIISSTKGVTENLNMHSEDDSIMQAKIMKFYVLYCLLLLGSISDFVLFHLVKGNTTAMQFRIISCCYGPSGPEAIKLFKCSTQLSMKFFLLINIKMPTIVGILILISRRNFMLSSALQEKSLNCW